MHFHDYINKICKYNDAVICKEMSATLPLVESNLCTLHPIDMKRFVIQVRNSKISLINEPSS